MPTMATDPRFGRGSPAGAVERPTHTIPSDCACSWTVIKAGPGMECISRLSYASALCRHKRDHDRDRQAALEGSSPWLR